jgi:hypothetical protein
MVRINIAHRTADRWQNRGTISKSLFSLRFLISSRVNSRLSAGQVIFQKSQSFSNFIGNLYSLFTPAAETAPN